MKRFAFALCFFSVLVFSVNAQENSVPDEEPEVQETYKYEINGRGDQFIKIAIMPSFPLNFGDQMKIGGAAELCYYRFLNSWLALGGELMAGYNLTKGSNIFTYVPISFGVMFQPSVWKIEFPVTLSLGTAFETCQNKKYFPGLSFKADLGAFFRMSETWSFGLGGKFVMLPEWYTKTENAKPDQALYMQISASARYHF